MYHPNWIQPANFEPERLSGNNELGECRLFKQDDICLHKKYSAKTVFLYHWANSSTHSRQHCCGLNESEGDSVTTSKVTGLENATSRSPGYIPADRPLNEVDLSGYSVVQILNYGHTCTAESSIK